MSSNNLLFAFLFRSTFFSFRTKFPMIRHTQPQPQQRIRTTSSFRSHLTEVRAYISRRRAWLLCIGLVCCVITVCGILFTVHLYYVEDGGAGWIKRSAVIDEDRTAFLPMRKIERTHLTERSPGFVPYFECGDQLQSCQAFNQPVSGLSAIASKSGTI